MTNHSAPKLAAPGAGLPPLELFVGRALFTLRRLMGNRDSFDAAFRRERELIGVLIGPCDDASASRRVLIRRPIGLEDSSRFWSIWMTLDHLRIVHEDLIRIIGSLIKDSMPEGEASTAAVKPSSAVSAEIVAAYDESCDALIASMAGAPNLKTAKRYAHPWFGPLDASGWHALAGMHMGIHRAQIQRILQGLVTEKISPQI